MLGVGILQTLRGAGSELLGQTLLNCQLKRTGHRGFLGNVEASHPGQSVPGQFLVQSPYHTGCLAGILQGGRLEKRDLIHSRLFSWIHQVLIDNGVLFSRSCLKCMTRAL